MMSVTQVPVTETPPTWHESIVRFKRGLIECALRQSHGNRTRAAEALGLQRTYLLRLMREMGVSAPCPVRRDAHLRATDVPARGTTLGEGHRVGLRTRSHAELR